MKVTELSRRYMARRRLVAAQMESLFPEGTYIAVDPMTATITVAPSEDDAGYLRNSLTFGWNVGDDPADSNEWCSGSWMTDESNVARIHVPALCKDDVGTEQIADEWATVAKARFASTEQSRRHGAQLRLAGTRPLS
jgi:hypothetical protein